MAVIVLYVYIILLQDCAIIMLSNNLTMISTIIIMCNSYIPVHTLMTTKYIKQTIITYQRTVHLFVIAVDKCI